MPAWIVAIIRFFQPKDESLDYIQSALDFVV